MLLNVISSQFWLVVDINFFSHVNSFLTAAHIIFFVLLFCSSLHQILGVYSVFLLPSSSFPLVFVLLCPLPCSSTIFVIAFMFTFSQHQRLSWTHCSMTRLGPGHCPEKYVCWPSSQSGTTTASVAEAFYDPSGTRWETSTGFSWCKITLFTGLRACGPEALKCISTLCWCLWKWHQQTTRMPLKQVLIMLWWGLVGGLRAQTICCSLFPMSQKVWCRNCTSCSRLHESQTAFTLWTKMDSTACLFAGWYKNCHSDTNLLSPSSKQAGCILHLGSQGQGNLWFKQSTSRSTIPASDLLGQCVE
jgi:hypothetical protein